MDGFQGVVLLHLSLVFFVFDQVEIMVMGLLRRRIGLFVGGATGFTVAHPGGLSLVHVFRVGVLVQEENGPILAAHMCLVGQHQLGQHVLVSADGSRVLMFHDGAAVNVERGNQDVLDMFLVRVGGVLWAHPFPRGEHGAADTMRRADGRQA